MALKYCSECGSPLGAGAKFCANCGSPTQAVPRADKEERKKTAPAEAKERGVPPPQRKQEKPKYRDPSDPSKSGVVVSKRAKNGPGSIKYKGFDLGFTGRNINAFLLIAILIVLFVWLISPKKGEEAMVREGEDVRVQAQVEALKEVLRKEPNNLKALKDLANAYYDMEDATQAVTHYKKYLELNPGDDLARVDMTTMLIRLRRYKEARAELEPIVARQTELEPVHLNLADLDRLDGNPQGQLKHLQEALKRCKDADHKIQLERMIDELKSQLKE